MIERACDEKQATVCRRRWCVVARGLSSARGLVDLSKSPQAGRDGGGRRRRSSCTKQVVDVAAKERLIARLVSRNCAVGLEGSKGASKRSLVD